MDVALEVNGAAVRHDIRENTLLVDLLRETLGLTGTHVGCDTSQCGACVVHVDGRAIKSCTVLAVALDGSSVTTIEGLAATAGGDALHPMQTAFHEKHGLQCGFCTPGMIMSAVDLVRQNPAPTEREVRAGLEGNLCRCTGYQNIVAAVIEGARVMRERQGV
ncbi:MAG: (2Fe-2S)-binding protein [Alphaproteobacteria bacterium]|nr:(2Fe-2S)-binding protein [Alphaproteobacteria bacterium]